MNLKTVQYRNWEFEVDFELTKQTYEKVQESGADSCICNDCKNYVAYKDNVFPDEILRLFDKIGIDYRKEVEITSFERLENGLHRIGGWFHFKGRLLSGRNCAIPLPNGGNSIELTAITDNFEIGFTEDYALTYFEEKRGLIQVEFLTCIPWIIDKSLETSN